MILPDAHLVWGAVHEAGHATVARACGVRVHLVTIVPGGGYGGHCDTRGETFPSARAMLCYQLAGAIAVKHRWRDHWELAMGTGQGDLRQAEDLVRRCWPADDTLAAFNAGLAATERFVEALWPDIEALAVRLLAERTVEFGGSF